MAQAYIVRRGGSSVKSIEKAVVELDQSSWTYDGNEHCPTVTKVTLGGQTLTEWQDYVCVRQATSQAGQYEVLVLGVLEYGGAKSAPWSIEKARGNVSLSEDHVALKGTVGTQTSVTVTKVGDGTLTIDNPNSGFVNATLEGESIQLTSVASGTAQIEVRLSDGTNYTGASCTLMVDVEVLIADPVFENNSWDTIASVCASGQAKEFWNIGDEKSFTRSGATYHFQIGGFDHDDLDPTDARYDDPTYNGGKKKAAITLIMKEVFTDNHRMGETNSNSCSWRDSEMRVTTIPQIKSEMNKDLISVVRKVTKKTAQSGSSSTILSTTDDLFLMSEIEAFGNSEHSAAGEGSCYEIFKSGNDRIKYQSGTAKWYWLRSPYPSSSSYFLSVNSDGTWGGNIADKTDGGVVLCVCI